MRPLALTVLLALPLPAGAQPPVEFGPVTERHVWVPMRDGTKLSVYLYLPPGKGPWPALLEQRYADLTAPATRKSFAKLAEGGYVVAAQNFRGAGKSEGQWVGYRALGWGEQKDGYDTVEWLAKQPWCTGKVGTFGSSQAGFAQNFLAVTRPPALKAQYMIDTGLSLFHEGYRIGGTTRPERFKQMGSVCRDPADNLKLLKEWFAHPTYDDYWAAEDCTRHFDKMDVPCFTVGSWYDFMCVGSVDSYVGRQHRGGPNSGAQQLILGPWLHGRFKNTNKAGDLEYPENARFDTEAHMLRWFDHHLKGLDTGARRDPDRALLRDGRRRRGGCPRERVANRPRLAGEGDRHAVPPHPRRHSRDPAPVAENASTAFAADPTNPATIPGRGFPGGKDARDFEKQPNVLTFTTDVLAEPVEWTGKVRAELYVSSAAGDADVIVRVSDVYPDGRSMLVMDYVRRLRYRNGYEKEVFMEPGRVYPVNFDVGWTSIAFNKGHRIRVTVASTGAPFYEPNPNTGEPLTLDPPARVVAAMNHLHLDRIHPSRVIAPVRRR